MELRKPLLPAYIILNQVERAVVYEGLYLLCFSCGKYGHLEKEGKEKAEKEAGGKARELEKEEDSTKLHGEWSVAHKPRRQRSRINPKGRQGVMGGPGKLMG
ncbi:hypothetical protein QN277_026601 [Acacia crassicarpa]|uniref:Uncharacterized protein n=1 Tax=Acacia crassicarpa TaxID=499986 RepID=A0AAE1MKX7_9FABA|nr:hypothetical protein QN277_026601 [Acacia crassicarpa]